VSRISYASLLSKLEQVMAADVFGSYPSNWDQAHITRVLVRSLRQSLNDTVVTGFKKNLAVSCEAFRYVGKEPPAYGDIAILVRIMHKDNSRLQGVSVIEARNRTSKKLTFDDLKWNQIGKLMRNTPLSQLLLYDYEDIRSFSSNLSMRVQSYRPSYWREQMMVSPYTYAVVTPTSVAMQVKTNDSSLYNFSVPFSNQIVFRYLHGFDLDFSKKALDFAAGRPNKLGFAGNLLCLDVTEEGAADMGKEELNREVWAALPPSAT
jgi:hypothetical protein